MKADPLRSPFDCRQRVGIEAGKEKGHRGMPTGRLFKALFEHFMYMGTLMELAGISPYPYEPGGIPPCPHPIAIANI